MPKITTAEVKIFLKTIEGKDITLTDLRSALGIEKYAKNGELTESFNYIRSILNQLEEQKIIRYLSRENYRIVKQVQPVRVFELNRQDRPPFELTFPRNFDTGMEMDFAEAIVIREGDLITIGGVKSQGKTTLCLNFCGENIDANPVLMGNEYTIVINDIEQPDKKYDVAARFYRRLKTMSEWIKWTDEEGQDKFTLLPVRDDYAEHIVKNRINIIDWINLDGGKLYDIGKVLEDIKKNLGRGIGIIALQKGELANNPRGGQFVRDFSDVEILLDQFGDNDGDILLTLKGVKEKKKPIVGKTYAYTIVENGVKIINFREVKRCPHCKSIGWVKGVKCEFCSGHKFIDTKEPF